MKRDDVTFDLSVNGVVIGLLLLPSLKVCWKVLASSRLNLIVFALFFCAFDY